MGDQVVPFLSACDIPEHVATEVDMSTALLTNTGGKLFIRRNAHFKALGSTSEEQAPEAELVRAGEEVVPGFIRETAPYRRAGVEVGPTGLPLPLDDLPPFVHGRNPFVICKGPRS